LLLTAAAIQLFVAGGMSFKNQNNSADVQDNATFGLSLINQQLRRTNSGNNQTIGVSGASNGLIFDVASLPTGSPSNFPLTAQDANLSATVDGKSDQLVIRYQALQGEMRDCEGNIIADRDSVIERYFLRQDTLSSETPKPYSLACAAFRNNSTSLANGATATGSIIVNRAEDLRILLGTSTSVSSSGVWRYYTIAQYMALTAPKPTIRTVRIGTLIRSTNSDGAAKNLPIPIYSLLDQTVTVATPSDGFLRRVFTTTVSFRNSLGDGA
jgi:type IV pilus assembly protein PilW